MKHIKLLEELKHSVFDVKDYFIDDMSRQSNKYYLWKVNKRENDEYIENDRKIYVKRLYVTKLYVYDFDFPEFLDKIDEDNYEYCLSLDDFDIIFQSDNLDEVLDELKLLVDIKKYNL